MQRTKNFMPILLILASLLTLLPQIWAQEIPLVDSQNMFVQDWHILAALGLGIAAGIVAISYMIGEALNVQSARAFAKAEARELIVSAALVLFVVCSLMAFGIFSQTLAQSGLGPSSGKDYKSIAYCQESQKIYPISGNKNPENMLYAQMDWFLGCMPNPSWSKGDTYFAYDKDSGVAAVRNGYRDIVYDSKTKTYKFADNILGEWPTGGGEVPQTGNSKGIMMTHLTNIYIGLFSLEFWLGPVSTFGTSFYGMEGMISSSSADFAPYAGLTPISEATITITDLIGVGIGVLFTQKVLLQFFHINALAVFLPLGLGFRAIPFMRKTGSTIIALALVAYFIFPMTIWINYNAYKAIYPADPAKRAMQDWTDYHTMLEIGSPEPGETPQEYELRVRKGLSLEPEDVDATWYEKAWSWLMSKWGSLKPEPEIAPGDMNIMMPARQLRTLTFSFFDRLGLMLQTVIQWVPSPSVPPEFIFDMLADELHTSMQWFVLNLLFLVNTIIISITMFRDISLTIGGDPRIFGLSKLV